MPIAERPRILFTSYTAEWTGPTKSLLLLLRHLRERYEIGVAYPDRGRLEDVIRELGVRGHPREALDKWEIPALARLIGRENYDLVYANNTHGSSRNAFLSSILAGVPFVCHVRGMGWDKGWLRLGYLRFSSGVVAVSEACAASVKRFVRPGRLHVVHNGIPVEDAGSRRAGSLRHSLRSELGVGADELVVVSLAHVCPRKGQREAVVAFRSMLEGTRDAHLCLVGSLEREPDYVEEVHQKARELDIADRVHLLGFREDVATVLADADVFLHTAVKDPHPRAVIEAMAAGLPVVAWSVDGVAETVVDGETGRLAVPGETEALAEALVSLAKRPGLRHEWGENGRRRARSEFTAGSTAQKIGRIIDGIIAEESE